MDETWSLVDERGFVNRHILVYAAAGGVNPMSLEVLCAVSIFMPISCRTACCRPSTVVKTGTV